LRVISRRREAGDGLMAYFLMSYKYSFSSVGGELMGLDAKSGKIVELQDGMDTLTEQVAELQMTIEQFNNEQRSKEAKINELKAQVGHKLEAIAELEKLNDRPPLVHHLLPLLLLSSLPPLLSLLASRSIPAYPSLHPYSPYHFRDVSAQSARTMRTVPNGLEYRCFFIPT